MADEKTSLIRLAVWLGNALGDSAPLFDGFSTDGLGVDLPTAITEDPAVKTALAQLKAAAGKVGDGAKKLETTAASGDDLAMLAAILKIGAGLVDFFGSLDHLIVHIDAKVTPATIPDAAARAAASAFVGELAKKIADYALSKAIIAGRPRLGFALKLAGLFDWENVPGGATDADRAHVKMGLRLDRLKTLISDPATAFKQALRWGENDFDPSSFFNLASDFFPEETSVDVSIVSGEPTIRGCVVVKRDKTMSPPGLKATLLADVGEDQQTRKQVTDEWGVGVSSTFRMTGGIGATIKPPLDFQLKPTAGQITGEYRAFFDRNPEARPFDIVGGTGLLTISANNAQIGFGMKAGWNGSTAQIDPLLFIDVDGLTLKIGTDDADGFIGSLLSAADIQGQFDLGLEWQAPTGLRVRASGGMEVALPVHRELGPITLETVYLALNIKNDGALALEISTALQGSLGPLSASVDRIGATADLRFAAGNDAKFGPFDVGLAFKPPNGVGLSIDAGVISGGGYLSIDTDRGEYAGALQLMFSGVIALSAIGIIDTRLPDGSSGFSLLIIITAEFGTGIQLGFGFVLLAVGGLLGLNRTMRLDKLAEGVRTDAVESVMFPKDVVANAPKIISDLRNFFPPQQGIFLIGPMAKLGWGTPALITAALGVIIEIPGDIAIVGVLKVALPTDEVSLLKLQVNFIGAIEFDKKRIWFFASLYDSHVVFLTIEGEMGLLVAFGDDANFVVSVGGFHPAFNPPPLPFPSPKRVAVNLINTDWAKVRVEGYFAVTSNTVQFGAAVEVFFGFSVISISGHLAFDALFQFSPFHFVLSISASFSLNVFGAGLFSVSISGELSGPAPWRVHGTGSIHILFIEVSADFDVSWGDANNPSLPPIEVMPIFKRELEKQESWQALLPVSSNLLVTLRKLPEDDALVLHPVGTLRIAQRALPLEITLDKVGNQKPSDAKILHLAVAGGGLAKKNDVFEKFAPAQFQDFSDGDKLSRPPYTPEPAGIELGSAGADLASSRMVKRNVRYEQIIVDSNEKRSARRFFNYLGSLFTFFLRGAAVTKCGLSNAKQEKLDPFADKITVNDESYTVALQSSNKAWSGASASFTSEARARQFMNQAVANEPNLADTLHVIPSYEKAA